MHALLDCFRSPFSAVVKFQKQFVDDVMVNVKKQKEEFDRHNHELRNRKVRLHLDHLEEEYLCCVCGKAGEEREGDDAIADEFSIIHMPSKERIEQGIVDYNRSTSSAIMDAENFRGLAPQLYALLGILTASAEGDTRRMVAKVQHSILNQEAADKHKKKKKSSHRDKGLMKIEESDIDMFQIFFKRSVHGYLCLDCHNSAKKRLDALTSQIQSILVKAKHPFLRVEGLLHGPREEETVMRLPHPTARTRNMEMDDKNNSRLSDSTIISLRADTRCAVCQRRQACYFERQCIIFLCQFCCARDRYYRDNAVCINDEFIPREAAHLLEALAKNYEKVKREREIDPLLTETEKANVNLFAQWNDVDLFVVQRMKRGSLEVKPTLPLSPSFVDRRSVAGNASLSLFNGKFFGNEDLFGATLVPVF